MLQGRSLVLSVLSYLAHCAVFPLLHKGDCSTSAVCVSVCVCVRARMPVCVGACVRLSVFQARPLLCLALLLVM